VSQQSAHSHFHPALAPVLSTLQNFVSTKRSSAEVSQRSSGTKRCSRYQHSRREGQSTGRYSHLHCYDSGQWCGSTDPKTQSE
ncbi:UNVERIFIED_CONTAM: hypothetical protein H355_009023, partial [Colinus virginianus]